MFHFCAATYEPHIGVKCCLPGSQDTITPKNSRMFVCDLLCIDHPFTTFPATYEKKLL